MLLLIYRNIQCMHFTLSITLASECLAAVLEPDLNSLLSHGDTSRDLKSAGTIGRLTL